MDIRILGKQNPGPNDAKDFIFQAKWKPQEVSFPELNIRIRDRDLTIPGRDFGPKPPPGIISVELKTIKRLMKRHVALFRDPPGPGPARVVLLPPLERDEPLVEVIEGRDGFRIEKQKQRGYIAGAPRAVKLHRGMATVAPNPDPNSSDRQCRWGQWEFDYVNVPVPYVSGKGTEPRMVRAVPGLVQIDQMAVKSALMPSRKEMAEIHVTVFERVCELGDLDSYYVLVTGANGNASMFPRLAPRAIKAIEKIMPVIEANAPVHDKLYALIMMGELHEAMEDFEGAILRYYDGFQICLEKPEEVGRGSLSQLLNFLGLAFKRADHFDAAETCYRLGFVAGDGFPKAQDLFLDLMRALSDARGNDAATRRVRNLGGLTHQTTGAMRAIVRCSGCGYPHGREKEIGDNTPPKELKKCSGCKTVVFCSRECQVSFWPEHKEACKLFQQERQKA